MRVLLGIGNPGRKYLYNRHNVGFMILDKLAGKYSLQFKPSKGDYYYAEGNLDNKKFLLIKPSTYVNNSGLAAKDILDKEGLSPEDLLVIYDDINIEHTRYRVRAGGSDGGHNGVGSIIYHLNSDSFPRIKVGIGQKFEQGRMAEFVLADFSKQETEQLKEIFSDAVFLSEEFIKGGIKQLLDANSKLQKTKRKLEN